MMISNQEQFQRLFLSLGFGALLGLYGEVFHLWRIFAKPTRLRLFLQDILFCVGATTLLFLFSLALGGGIWRLGLLIAVAIGFVCTRITVGRWLLVIAQQLKRFSKLLQRGLSRLFTPIKRIGIIFVKKVTIFSKKGLHTLRRVVYNHKE